MHFFKKGELDKVEKDIEVVMSAGVHQVGSYNSSAFRYYCSQSEEVNFTVSTSPPSVAVRRCN